MEESLIFNSQIDRHRILWIDVVKGILIILMVFGHCIQFGSGTYMIEEYLFFENPVFRFIYSFHMPCLMLLSGFFYGTTINKPNLWINRIRTILIPILVWSCIPAGLSIRKAIYTGGFSVIVIVKALRIVITYYWFLWAILFCSVITWAVHRFCRDNAIAYTVIGIILLFVPKVINIEMWIYMYPYFVVGFLCNMRKVKIGSFEEHKLISTVVLVVLFFCLFTFYDTDAFIYTTGITVRDLRQLGIDLYRFAIGFTGSIMIIWLVYILLQYFERKAEWSVKTLAYCGRVTLTVYFHAPGLKPPAFSRLASSKNLINYH